QSSSLHPTREPLSGPRINRNLLIPPIVFLPTASKSNMSPSDAQRPRPQQLQALANGIASANKVKEAFTPELAYPASLPTTPTVGQSNHNILLPSNASGLLSSTLSTSHHPNLPTAEPSSSQVPGVVPPNASPQDSLSAIYLQLQAKSDALASLALPTLPSRTPIPHFAAPSNISQLAAGLSSAMNTKERGAIILRHPYPQSSSTSKGTLDQELLPSDDSNALALTCSQTTNLEHLRLNAWISKNAEQHSRSTCSRGRLNTRLKCKRCRSTWGKNLWRWRRSHDSERRRGALEMLSAMHETINESSRTARPSRKRLLKR
ncbi:hypothetical protein DFH29DRAFT_975661, partial [Suillus ampliporus]